MPHTRIRTSYDLGPEGSILIASLEADPAAGAEMVVTIPGRAVWEVTSIRYTLQCDATVATRGVNLIIDDGENMIAQISRPATQTANQARSYTFYQGAEQDSAQVNALANRLPLGLTMLPGWRIRTTTSNLQAGDNFSAPVLYVREVPQRGIDAGQDALLSALRRLIDREV